MQDSKTITLVYIGFSETIQMAAATGNIRGMYDGIKKALGPTQSKTAPLNLPLGKSSQTKASR